MLPRSLSASVRSSVSVQLLVMALCVIATPGTAQDRPVVFVHGLFGTNADWQATANHLSQQFQISPLVPTLGWFNTYETQASNLQTSLGSNTGVAAMGWSNGGVVERRYVQQSGAASRINRGFTVGTPHRGSKLAQYVRDGTAERYADYLFRSIADPYDFYYAWDEEFRDAMNFGPNILLRIVFEYIAYLAYYMLPIINSVAVPVAENIPIGPQMSPSSSFIAALNSSPNLAIEQANMLTRVSSATSVSPQNAFFTLFSDDPEEWGDIRLVTQYYALLLFAHYSSHPDFFLRANAWRWLELAGAMANFDVNWLFLTGSVLGVDAFGQVLVEDQDGLLPLSSQTWPGATHHENRLWPSFTIPHRQQITHPAMLLVMENVVNVTFDIPMRPPPLQASISGPSSVEESQYATWTGGTSGGSSPYTYQWTVDGLSAGNGSSHTNGGWAGGSSHTVSLTVTDGAGRTATTELSVYVTPTGGCIYPPCP